MIKRNYQLLDIPSGIPTNSAQGCKGAVAGTGPGIDQKPRQTDAHQVDRAVAFLGPPGRRVARPGQIDDQANGGAGFVAFRQHAFPAPFDEALVAADARGQQAARRRRQEYPVVRDQRRITPGGPSLLDDGQR